MKKVVVVFIGLILFSCGETNSNQSNNSDSSDSTQVAEDVKPFKKIEFPSKDSLTISANLYEADNSYPLMILFHQRGFCKFEYAGVAERFNKLGYNCLAVDLRCGGPIANEPNETWLRAVEQNKPTDFLDADQDIAAAIEYGYNLYERPVILLGSSYSSTLVIYHAISNEQVAAVISFSPGNYFFYDGVKSDLTSDLIKFEKPFFFTAAREEMPYVRELVMGRQRTENQIVFAPEGEGHHGARALWPDQVDGEEYWAALELFLQKLEVE
jgi:hypothetical protein